MRSAPDLDPRALAALYDEGYYHGVNSGHSAAGYEVEHATWAHWVAYAAPLYPPGSRWLDLGCAYGYLVAEAAAGGFRATGIDISRYALGRAAADAPAAAGRVTRGLLERLPFANGTFAVVSAFDVLEHLVDPEAALAEVRRVLCPGGALIGATPDPLVFDRDEETHVSERPPSYWIDRLLALGLSVDFRFYQAPFNLEFVARRDGAALAPAARLRWDGFANDVDLPEVGGPAADRLAVRLRDGFGSAGLTHGARVRWLAAGEGSAYVLVAGRAPARITVQLELRGDVAGSDVTIAVDDQRIAHVNAGARWTQLECAPLPLAAGGHHLRFRTSAPLLVRRLAVVGDECARADLLARLPFDMFQRYDQCRAVLATLPAARPTLLDVGGVLGGAGGHLAASGDFFVDAIPLSIDVRGSDHPDHRAVPNGPWPFADASFDVVVCQDVLEHVAGGERRVLLDEIRRVARRFVLLAAPFATDGVGDADRLLFELIQARHGYAHAFLREHLERGHPDLAGTVAYWESAGARVVVLPNGHLPYWSAMQLLNLSLAEPAMGERYARAQAAYNAVAHDWREPAYRHVLVIDTTGRDDWCEAVLALAAAEAAAAVNDANVSRVAGALHAALDLAHSEEPAPSIMIITDGSPSQPPTVTGTKTVDAADRGEASPRGGAFRRWWSARGRVTT
jgi:SAM-dependent methyltransferase